MRGMKSRKGKVSNALIVVFILLVLIIIVNYWIGKQVNEPNKTPASKLIPSQTVKDYKDIQEKVFVREDNSKEESLFLERDVQKEMKREVVAEPNVIYEPPLEDIILIQ